MTLQEEIQYHAMIRSEIPELLAELANAGRKDDALKLLVQWGTHAKVNSEVWQDAKNLLREKSA